MTRRCGTSEWDPATLRPATGACRSAERPANSSRRNPVQTSTPNGSANRVTKFKAADETRSSSTLTDDGTLTFPVKNGVTYLIEGRLLIWQPSGTEKVQWSYSAPAATLANRNDFYSNNNEGSVRVKVEDGSFTAVTDVATVASLCSLFVSVLLTPRADGTFALQWANQDAGDTTGPTLKKGSWLRMAPVG